jgi:uncharacterized protein (DUF433 family)
MDWRERIVSDPETLFGKPRIKGTRIGVAFLLDRLADGWSPSDLLESYPTITSEDLRAVFAFARDQVPRTIPASPDPICEMDLMS